MPRRLPLAGLVWGTSVFAQAGAPLIGRIAAFRPEGAP
jgi:hypothetical protein